MKMLDYYLEKGISTEHGVDDDYVNHVRKRRNLYRQLGIPVMSFKGSIILEVGPGEGHNSLPLLKEWDCEHIDFVEPNKYVVDLLKEKLNKEGFDDRYSVYEKTLDEFTKDKRYDFVICEGFLHCDSDWKREVKRLSDFMHSESILILTCSDEIGMYVEKMKRVVGQLLVKGIDSHSEKMKMLLEFMTPQLKLIKNMSRRPEDWIEDMVFSPSTLSNELMTMGDVIEFIGDGYDVLGASQNIFCDHSWYKDIDYKYTEDYIIQYKKKRHSFFIAGNTEDENKDIEEAELIYTAAKNANITAKHIEEDKDNTQNLIQRIKEVSKICNGKIESFNSELIDIISVIDTGKLPIWENYPVYACTFGKSMQYISFIKSR